LPDLQILRSSFGFLVRSGLGNPRVDSVTANTGAVVPDGGPLIRRLSAIVHCEKSGRSGRDQLGKTIVEDYRYFAIHVSLLSF
jgi:hypothetical protein